MSRWLRRVRATWSDDDNAEYDEAMTAAWAERGISPEQRQDIFLDAIESGIQAHRVWARDIERTALHRGAWSLLRSWRRARPRPIEMNWKGQIHLRTPMIGVKRRSGDGEVFDQQVLVHFATFGELRTKLTALLVSVKAYELDIHMIVRLLALEEQVEDADDSWTPAQACKALGTTLEEYLSAHVELAA